MIDIGLNNSILITRGIDEAIQEIDILFNTTNTELLGDTSYGINFLQFLWECTPSPTELKKYIMEKIDNSTVYCRKYSLNIDVKHYTDNYNESIYVVNISITDPDTGDTVNKEYKIK